MARSVLHKKKNIYIYIYIYIYGQSKQIAALTFTDYCDRCQWFPLRDCTWYVRVRGESAKG